MRNVGNSEPQQVELTASYQEATPINRTNTLFDQHQQFNQNLSKRYKGGDDSFEYEHRLAPDNNKYFYINSNRSTTNTLTTNTLTTNTLTTNTLTTNTPTTTRPSYIGSFAGARQGTFPPFKINFVSGVVPSELAIIKNINKYCKISLSYGRFSSMGNRKKLSFLCEFERAI